jgi:hypothetical protein
MEYTKFNGNYFFKITEEEFNLIFKNIQDNNENYFKFYPNPEAITYFYGTDSESVEISYNHTNNILQVEDKTLWALRDTLEEGYLEPDEETLKVYQKLFKII